MTMFKNKLKMDSSHDSEIIIDKTLGCPQNGFIKNYTQDCTVVWPIRLNYVYHRIFVNDKAILSQNINVSRLPRQFGHVQTKMKMNPSHHSGIITDVHWHSLFTIPETLQPGNVLNRSRLSCLESLFYLGFPYRSHEAAILQIYERILGVVEFLI